jgi:hypothetical protein
MHGPNRETWIATLKPEAPQIVGEVLRPSMRITIKQILADLPPLSFRTYEAEMSKVTRKLYEDFKRDLLLEFKSGLIVTAMQKATKLLKLFQIAAGAVLATDKSIVQVDCGPRLEVIKDLVLSTEGKSIIFSNFIAVSKILTEYLNNQKIPTGRVDGSISGQTRDQVFLDFQNHDKYKVLVAHPITTAYGLEFGMADKIILNGPMLNGVANYLQSMSQLSSAKQKSNNILVMEVVASKEEAAFLRELRSRAGLA